MNLLLLYLVLQGKNFTYFIFFWGCHLPFFFLRLFLSATSGAGDGLKKPDLLRNPRYIDTRMDEVYPAKKSRFRMLSKKENDKVLIDITLDCSSIPIMFWTSMYLNAVHICNIILFTCSVFLCMGRVIVWASSLAA